MTPAATRTDWSTPSPAPGPRHAPEALYTMANFHNLSATTLTLERRKAVIEICDGTAPS